MHISSLNVNFILLEKNFRVINKELSTHIKKLENDANEVNLNIVKLMAKKANSYLNEIDNVFKSNLALRDLDNILERNTKRLNNLKRKFEAFLKDWQDNEFEKETIQTATEIITDLISKIETTIDGIEDEVKKFMKKIANEVQDEIKSSIKVPRGLAQDLVTRKIKIVKNK